MGERNARTTTGGKKVTLRRRRKKTEKKNSQEGPLGHPGETVQGRAIIRVGLERKGS